jgi:hypothetical protein
MTVRRAYDLRGSELEVRRAGSVASVILPILKQYDLVELVLDKS